MDMAIWISALIASLVVLVKSADIFTHSSERIGLYFGLSSFIVGATIVSVGSSLPELATSTLAILNVVLDGGDPKQLQFPIDNIIGSNIANCLLVGGITAIAVGTLKVKERLIDIDLPFFFISSALFFLFIMDGEFVWTEGLICLALLAIFITYTIKDVDEEEAMEAKKERKKNKEKLGFKPWMMIAIGIIGIYFSAKYTVVSVLKISEMIPNVNTTMITMLVVAIGTSLPEVIVSVQAALKGKHSIALGNVFGSNTFNALAVSGIPSLITPLKVSDMAMHIGIPFFIVASLAFLFATSDDKIQKWEGYALLVLYGAFVGKLVGIV